MKKSEKVIAAILVISSLLLLSSCNSGNQEYKDDSDLCHHTASDFYPEGYTCGFPSLMRQHGGDSEIWWVETYAECVAAIELLKANGSTFKESAIFSYDGELFDTKYCFKIYRGNRFTEEIKFGDNPFDRKALNVKVTAYAFFEEVTIDEINYGDVKDYGAHGIEHCYLDTIKNDPMVTPDDFSIEYYDYTEKHLGKGLYVWDYVKSRMFLHTSTFGYENDPVKAKACIYEIMNSLVFVEFLGLDD